MEYFELIINLVPVHLEPTILTITPAKENIMIQFLKFINDESGAVTVDWVVLTAAIVGIALAVIALISSGIQDASNGINDELNNATADAKIWFK